MRIFVPPLRNSPASRSASKTPNRNTPRDEFESLMGPPVTMDVRRIDLVRTISEENDRPKKSVQTSAREDHLQFRKSSDPNDSLSFGPPVPSAHAGIRRVVWGGLHFYLACLSCCCAAHSA